MTDAEQQRALRMQHALDVGSELVDVAGEITELIVAQRLYAVIEISTTDVLGTGADGANGFEQPADSRVAEHEVDQTEADDKGDNVRPAADIGNSRR